MTEVTRSPVHAAAESGAEERQLSAVRAGAVSTNGRRSPIPSRNPTVRRRVRELAATLGYEPTPGDLYALTRWAHLFEKWRSIGERLDASGEVKASGEPKKLLGEWRALSAELSRLEAQLGITAAARAGLGVDIARLRAASKGEAGGASDEDVAAAERRIMERLRADGPAQEELTGAARTDPPAELQDTTSPEGEVDGDD